MRPKESIDLAKHTFTNLMPLLALYQRLADGKISAGLDEEVPS